MVKKNPVQPLRRGSNPQTRRRNPLMESEYENSTLEENSDLPASYADDNPDEGDMDMESFPSDQHLTDLEECGEIPYDAQSPFQELVETEPSISSSSSSSSSVIAVPRTPEPRVPDPTLLNAAVAPIVSDGVPRENPREQHRQIPLSPVVIDVVPNPQPNPQYNMEQVTTALKQTMTGGLNLQKPLFIIDTPEITGEQAAQFQNQANQWHENFLVHQVVVNPATYVVQYAFASDPEFTLIPPSKYSTWYNHVTVKQAAQIITKYFGDRNDIGRTLVENFSRLEISFCYTNADIERKSFMALKALTTVYENTQPITPAQHAALIVTIEKKLKPDSQLKSDYFAARGNEGKPIPNETWEQAFTRLGKCIFNVRKLVERVANYGDTSAIHTLFSKYQEQETRQARTPIIPEQRSYAAAVYLKSALANSPANPQPSAAPAHAHAHASSPSAAVLRRPTTESIIQLLPQPAPIPCRSCGHTGHEVRLCPVLFRTDANHSELHLQWKDSTAGKMWHSYGFEAYDDGAQLPNHAVRYLVKPVSEFRYSMLQLPNKRARFDNGGATVPTLPGQHDPANNAQYAETRRNRKQGKSVSLNAIVAASITRIEIDSNFLSSWIFINQRSIVKDGVRVQVHTSPNNHHHPTLRAERVLAKVLLDTGSLPGDFISQDFVISLNAQDFVYTSSKALTICSGLDNTCYVRDQVIDIGMTFVTHNLLINTIFLTVRIIPNTIDLILGRKTLKKYDFFEKTPYEIGRPNMENSFERMKVFLSAECIPSECVGKKDDLVCPHSGNSTMTYHKIDSNRVANCSDVGCSSQPNAAGVEPTRNSCNYVSNHSGVIRTRTYTLAHLCEMPEGTPTATTVETPSGIIISSDEIDNDKTDTFRPFLPERVQQTAPPPGPEDFLSQIKIDGTEHQQFLIRQLCLKYADIFSDKLAVKPARLPPFVIKVNKRDWECSKNRTAVRLQSVRKEREIKRAIDEMLNSGVIEESNAVYYSHPVIVQRTADLFRFCIDYRNLNKCTQASSWPLPNIRALFERIGHQQPVIFGVMDLTSGYHQAPMDQGSKVLTAFICYCGVYQFTRLPFGPRRAPSYFQEMMATIVLNGLIYISCEMYLDDCIVFARGQDEFLERLERVFRRFRCFGLLLKAKKCRFGMSQIDYVGRQISSQGISMSKEKIESVLNFPKPMTLTSLRSLLGLANYFRNFVPFHSDIVAPLQRMIDPKGRKKSALQWTTEADKAFVLIRQAISRCPLLHFLDEVSPIELYTDASDYGVGGVLFQVTNSVKNPISFVSKSLSATQVKWSTIQKEAYAIYFCCKQLDSLIRDRKFIIHTDHKNLTFLGQDPSAMVNRWSMALQELDYTVSYISGPKNFIADALSRLCPNLTQLVFLDPPTRVEEIDVHISALHEVAPVTELQLEAIEMCHNAMVGHGGIARTLDKLSSIDEEWLDMTSHVRDFIRNCACCQKMSVIKIPVHIHKYTTSTYRPFDTVNIDYIGPYPDNGYVLVMICSFTRWTELYWCVNNTAQCACECLLQFFGRFGAPSMIRSDRGSHFMNEIIREFLLRTGTPHNLTLAYSKQENAIVERVNKEVNRHLRAFTFHSTNLEAYRLCLPFVQRIINSSVHSSTGASPASLLFGNQLNLDRGILVRFPDQTQVPTRSSKVIADMLLIQTQLNDLAINKLKTTDTNRVAVNTEPRTIFPIGSYVLTLNPRGAETRLHSMWLGPFLVVSYDKSEYTIKNLITKKNRDVHASQLKPFRFNPTSQSPTDTARRDYMEFFIEEIVSHVGNKKKPSTMKFYVKWLNYDSNHNSWEPWKSMRATDQLHTYLRNNNMLHVIPKEFRNMTPNTREEP